MDTVEANNVVKTPHVSEQTQSKPWQFQKGNEYAIKPGEVRNPTGRPRSAARLLKQADGDLIARKIMERAEAGDMRAAQLYLEYTDGKPLQANLNVNVDERTMNMSDDEWSDFIERENARRAAVVHASLDQLPGSPTITLRSAK